jgi:hypothetical protein
VLDSVVSVLEALAPLALEYEVVLDSGEISEVSSVTKQKQFSI